MINEVNIKRKYDQIFVYYHPPTNIPSVLKFPPQMLFLRTTHLLYFEELSNPHVYVGPNDY